MENTPDDQTSVTHWWWLRHAPTGLSGQMIGATDVPARLTDKAFLKTVGQTLPPEARWLVSPRLRCQQTAEALLAGSAGMTTDPLVIEAFAEQDFGDWETLSYDDPAVRDAATFWQDPAGVAPPNGESFAALCQRVGGAVNDLSGDPRLAGVNNVVVVAHAGVVRAAVTQALDLKPEQALKLQIDPLSLTCLSHFVTRNDTDTDTSWGVQYINRI